MAYLLNKTPHCMETPPTMEKIIVWRTFFHTMSMCCIIEMMIFFKGFHSGPKRLEGGYVQTFHGTGTLTYASDSAIGEDSDAILTGSVVVSVPGMDDDSYSEDLDIKVCTSCKYNFDVKNIRTKIITTCIIY